MQTEPKEKKKPSIGTYLCNFIKSMDQMSEGFEMNIDTEGKKKQTTILGTSFTIFLYFIVGIYSVQQFIIMQENKKIDMITATSEYFFAETDVFNES